jgi:cytidylate kinase
MAYGVVCIAQVGGSVGAEVGRQVAEALGYRLVDEEIIQRAAESEGIDVEELAVVEKRKGVLNRLLDSLALGGAADGFMAGMPAVTPSLSVVDPKGLRSLIRKSILETAADGNVVIVSHAASFALAGKDGVLRVLVTASKDTRVARVLEANDGDAKKAAKAVENDDAGRADYLKKFYSVDRELSTHYDVVLNSDHLSSTAISDLVVRAAQAN